MKYNNIIGFKHLKGYSILKLLGNRLVQSSYEYYGKNNWVINEIIRDILDEAKELTKKILKTLCLLTHSLLMAGLIGGVVSNIMTQSLLSFLFLIPINDLTISANSLPFYLLSGFLGGILLGLYMILIQFGFLGVCEDYFGDIEVTVNWDKFIKAVIVSIVILLAVPLLNVSFNFTEIKSYYISYMNDVIYFKEHYDKNSPFLGYLSFTLHILPSAFLTYYLIKTLILNILYNIFVLPIILIFYSVYLVLYV